MSDSVDPMNSSQPLGASFPSRLRQCRRWPRWTPSATRASPRPLWRRSGTRHPRSSRIPDAVFRGDHPAERDFGVRRSLCWWCGNWSTKSQLSLHQFGIQFFYGHELGPGQRQLRRDCRSSTAPWFPPSSLLLLAVPLSSGSSCVRHRDVSAASAVASFRSWWSCWLPFPA